MDAIKPAFAGLAVLIAVAATPVRADNAVATAIKATYLVKLAHYISWPTVPAQNATDPINLCIVGSDPFGSTIDQAARGEHVDGRPILIHRLATLEQNSPCHIVFVAGALADKTLPIIAGSPMLSVTDADETPIRALLQFDVHAGHVGFHIDDNGAHKVGLEISSRLLAIAISLTSRQARP